MVVIVHFGNGDDQEPVLLARIAVNDGRAVIRSRLISAEHFLRKGLLKVNHQVLIKF